jgi:hypothetical protein
MMMYLKLGLHGSRAVRYCANVAEKLIGAKCVLKLQAYLLATHNLFADILKVIFRPTKFVIALVATQV